MRLTLGVLAGALLAAPLAAQQQPDSMTIKAQERIAAILGIPRRADEARRAGVPDSTLRGVLDILVKERVPAKEAEAILVAERDGAAEHGPTDNFGAFVQAQLAAGKRGQELAAAIRAEHRARGKGRPAGVGRPGAADQRGRRPDDSTQGGRPDGTGRGVRPAGAGRGGPPDAMNKKSAADSARGKRPDGPAAKGKRPH
jgi:hypothetical protein